MDRLIIGAAFLLLTATVLVARIWTSAHRTRIPAAPDNQAGRDMGLLQECRLIATTPRKEKPQP
jgi:hypothetical protein